MQMSSRFRGDQGARAIARAAALVAVLAFGPAVAWPAEGTSATSSGGAAGASAGTSAALPPAPATSSPTPAAAPDATPASTTAAAGDDATGKPAAADIRLGHKAPVKKALARVRRKAKDAVATGTPAEPAPAQPNFLDALFGNAPPAADPATTAATDPVIADPTLLPKGKHGKTVKTAKTSPGGAVPASTGDSGASLLSDQDTPWASGELGHPLLSPGNIEPLKAAIKRYTDIVAHGGWTTVPPLQMEAGTNNEAVSLLRQRLAAEGDLKVEPSGFSGPNNFDQDVGDALRRFQDRYGLNPTGDLMDPDRLKNGTRTVAALNVSAQARLAQLNANLKRLQQQVIAKGRYVVVNIPGQQIEAVDNNVVALRLNGVVGKPERPSPMLSSNIEEVKFNPIWTLPPTVVKEDLIPKGQSLQAKGVDVLAKFGIDAYDGNGRKLDTSTLNWSSQTTANLRFSEQPGKDNPLGFAKLDFASPESVYMHDTPSSKLFDKSYRAASSGCIRVDHMDRLVSWLLKDTDGWSPARVAGMKESGESKIVRIKRSVPLHWVYITAWATEDGTVHFRRDLYGKDQAFGVSQTASAY